MTLLSDKALRRRSDGAFAYSSSGRKGFPARLGGVLNRGQGKRRAGNSYQAPKSFRMSWAF
jgi:hypothetical protein